MATPPMTTAEVIDGIVAESRRACDSLRLSVPDRDNGRFARHLRRRVAAHSVARARIAADAPARIVAIAPIFRIRQEADQCVGTGGFEKELRGNSRDLPLVGVASFEVAKDAVLLVCFEFRKRLFEAGLRDCLDGRESGHIERSRGSTSFSF